MRTGRTVLVLAAAAAALLSHGAVAAQERPRGGVGGSVLDARTGAPISGAAVVLQPEVVGVFPAGPASSSPFATTSRTALTEADGSYHFDQLAPGAYRIYVSRIGYRPYSVTVELRGAAMSPVAVALIAEPISLEPVHTRAYRRGGYESADAFTPDAPIIRLLLADQARMRFLTTDAREITHADVVEAVTLGEPDVLRALQRLPGVTTRSDYTAELWTRGAPWSHTRVYFDGIPLYNPLHALGILSGIGSNAIGTVWFHPGARTASLGEGAAGVVDLQSRRAGGDGALNVAGDLSLQNVALALDQRVLDGRAGWMVSGRQSYIDWLTRLARHASGSDDPSFPYSFSEVAGRVDAWTGDATAVEASWLWERDELTSVQAGGADALRAEWGNAAARVSLATRVGRLRVHHTAGLSRHEGVVRSSDAGPIPAGPAAVRQSETVVQYIGASGTISPDAAALAGPEWSFGYGVERQRVGYFGPQVLPVPRFTVARMEAYEDQLSTQWQMTLPQAVLWAERNWSVGERLGLRTGLRMEAGREVARSGSVRWSPRVSARFMATPEVSISAGASRVYQYAQAIAPGGVHVVSLSTTDVWLLAGPAQPALRADILTVGGEAWLAPGRAVSVNAFARRARDVASADPRPGLLYNRPAFALGDNTARGVEVSLRQITGRVTGSASYTLSRSEMQTLGLRYASPADRPHVFNATAMARATQTLRAGAAFTAASGVPFTRTIATPEECALDAACDPAKLPWLADPNAARAPVFASLDLLLDWTTTLGELTVGAYAQLRNALGRENATIYTGDESSCMPDGCGAAARSSYERGMPRLPVLGVRVRH